VGGGGGEGGGGGAEDERGLKEGVCKGGADHVSTPACVCA